MSGRIGAIRSTFWRRVALIFSAAPRILWTAAPYLARNFPSAIAQAWDAFTGAYDDRGWRLLTTGLRECWAEDWTIDK